MLQVAVRCLDRAVASLVAHLDEVNAIDEQLHDAAVLERQVRRMIADPRSKGFIANFFGQWLALRALASAQPDPRVLLCRDPDLEGYQAAVTAWKAARAAWLAEAAR